MEVVNNLAPDECGGMEDIRREIDLLDQAVIKILGIRFNYVLAASRFKTSETSVRAPERFEAMLSKRREWAEAEGLSPDAIERLYTDLVNHLIARDARTHRFLLPGASCISPTAATSACSCSSLAATGSAGGGCRRRWLLSVR